MNDMDTIRADFDRLASLEAETWNHNNHYHRFMLTHVPSPCIEALDIGCGAGVFTRLLAQRAQHVHALDLSPEMIRVARARSPGIHNITYQVGDVLACTLPAGRFDCIASIATFHHLPIEEILLRARDALTEGGVLINLDLFVAERLSERALGVISLPPALLLRLIKTGRLRDTPAEREAWAAHGAHDHYPFLSEVRRACAAILPGAVVQPHPFWRYSLIWRKPGQKQALSIEPADG
jgi:SAM-dependent methyltransferase